MKFSLPFVRMWIVAAVYALAGALPVLYSEVIYPRPITTEVRDLTDHLSDPPVWLAAAFFAVSGVISWSIFCRHNSRKWQNAALLSGIVGYPIFIAGYAVCVTLGFATEQIFGDSIHYVLVTCLYIFQSALLAFLYVLIAAAICRVLLVRYSLEMSMDASSVIDSDLPVDSDNRPPSPTESQQGSNS